MVKAPPAAQPAGQHGPSVESLAALVGLAALISFWFLFLWFELVLARSGGSVFCALGDGADCTAAWSSSFASDVHRLSGLPLAAWGFAWGLVALALPLVALLRAAQGRREPAVTSAIRILAGAGLVTACVMMLISTLQGAFCVGCFVADVALAGYAGIAVFGWSAFGLPQAPRAAALASLGMLAAYVALLYPGNNTPRTTGEAARAAVTAAVAAAPASGTEGSERDHQLAQLVESLDPALQQSLSDALAVYRRSVPVAGAPAPRHLLGSAAAPVKITEWTDVRCDHCAGLHAALKELMEQAPEGSFSLDARQFPLDAECNSLVKRSGEPIRCLGARASICLEPNPKSFEFAGALFARQKELTPALVYEIAAPYMDKASLERCVNSPETKTRLEQDIAFAAKYDPDGTPIVAINGKLASPFPPFLYAMVLTGGSAENSGFQRLPAAH